VISSELIALSSLGSAFLGGVVTLFASRIRETNESKKNKDTSEQGWAQRYEEISKRQEATFAEVVALRSKVDTLKEELEAYRGIAEGRIRDLKEAKDEEHKEVERLQGVLAFERVEWSQERETFKLTIQEMRIAHEQTITALSFITSPGKNDPAFLAIAQETIQHALQETPHDP